MMSRGLAMLTRAKLVADGHAITYTRAAVGHAVTGWPGDPNWRRDPVGPPGTTVVRAEADYLFAAAELMTALGSMPVRGDRFTDSEVLDPVTGSAVVFEVQPPAGQPAWHYSGTDKSRVRVHCKRVGS